MRQIKGTDMFNIFELEINFSAYAFLDEEWQYENACDPFSRLYYVRSGHGFLKCGNPITELVGGNVYFIPAECQFSYGCEEMEKLYFHISVTGMERYDLFSGVQKICSLPFTEEDFNTLLACYASNDYLDLMKVKMILYQTLVGCAEKHHFGKMPVKRYSEVVEKTMHYIRRNAKVNLSIAEIAGRLFLSESKLRKIFKEETKMTIGTYVDDLIFIKAKKLLTKKKIPIGEISQRLGFCDQFYFSRRFKEKFGQTRSEFRKERMIF